MYNNDISVAVALIFSVFHRCDIHTDHCAHHHTFHHAAAAHTATAHTHAWTSHHHRLFNYNSSSAVWTDDCNFWEEFGSELDSSCWLAHEEDFDPLSQSNGLTEKVQGDTCLTNHFTYERVSITHFNIDFVHDIKNGNLHKLKFPARISSTTDTNSRSPLLKVYFHNHQRIHSFSKNTVWITI